MTDNKNNPRNLQSLYPEALTVEEVYQRDAARRMRNKLKVPRYARLKIAAFLGAILYAFILLILNLEHLWMAGALPGVAVSFIAMITLFFLCWGVGVYVDRVFHAYDRSSGGFILLCLLYGFLSLVLRLELKWASIFAVLVFTALVMATQLLVLRRTED